MRWTPQPYHQGLRTGVTPMIASRSMLLRNRPGPKNQISRVGVTSIVSEENAQPIATRTAARGMKGTARRAAKPMAKSPIAGKINPQRNAAPVCV